MALAPDGTLVVIEIKSGRRDFLTDQKWPDYLAYADAFYFAVDGAFPRDLLPPEPGIILSDPAGAEMLRHAAPCARLAAPRRRALLLRFACLAAERLAECQDPSGVASLRASLRSD